MSTLFKFDCCHRQKSSYAAGRGGARWSSPLCDAVAGGDVDVIRDLLTSKSSVNQLNAAYDTPLHIAAQHGNCDVTRLLLTAGADVNQGARFMHGTPLFAAAAHGHHEVAKALIEAKASVNQINAAGNAPLHTAVVKAGAEFLSTVEALLDARALVNQPDKDGRTPLMLAASKGNMDVYRPLLGAGADLQVADSQGRTAQSYFDEMRQQPLRGGRCVLM